MPSIRRQTGSRLVSSWLVEFPDNEAVKLLGIRCGESRDPEVTTSDDWVSIESDKYAPVSVSELS